MTRPSTKPRQVIPPGTTLAPEDVVVWNWPLRDEGLRSWAMLLGVAVSASVVWTLSRSPIFTLLTAAALMLSLWRLWLPVKWELRLTGITQTALGLRRQIPWLAIARFEIRDDGVWLFADRQSSPLRGVFIGYGDQRQKVVTIVDYYLGTWTHSSDATESRH